MLSASNPAVDELLAIPPNLACQDLLDTATLPVDKELRLDSAEVISALPSMVVQHRNRLRNNVRCCVIHCALGTGIMLRIHLAYLTVCFAALASAGGCCTPCGGPVGTMAGGRGGAPMVIGGGGLLGLAGCRAGCGEVYVDEWLSEPPHPDNCGFSCGGCGSCQQCQPVRNALRLLWGRPYASSCCSSGCDSGCDSCDGGGGEIYHDGLMSSGYASGDPGCNCGHDHPASSHNMHMPPAPSMLGPGTSTMEVVPTPQQVPTPAPTVGPSSAKRLNPAQQRLNVRSASTQVNRR